MEGIFISECKRAKDPSNACDECPVMGFLKSSGNNNFTGLKFNRVICKQCKEQLPLDYYPEVIRTFTPIRASWGIIKERYWANIKALNQLPRDEYFTWQYKNLLDCGNEYYWPRINLRDFLREYYMPENWYRGNIKTFEIEGFPRVMPVSGKERVGTISYLPNTAWYSRVKTEKLVTSDHVWGRTLLEVKEKLYEAHRDTYKKVKSLEGEIKLLRLIQGSNLKYKV